MKELLLVIIVVLLFNILSELRKMEPRLWDIQNYAEKTQKQTQYLEDYLDDIQTQIINVVNNTQSLNR